MSESKAKLFSEFEPVSTQAWTDKIKADLKGADFEKRLVWKTNEGFNVNPFYRAEDIQNLKTTGSLPGEFPYVRGAKTDNDWYVRQDIEVKDIKDANKKALGLLNKGVTSLGFIVPRDSVNAENIDALLGGILPECIELNFKTCSRVANSLIDILTAYFRKKKVDAGQINASVNCDLIGTLLRKAKGADDWAVRIAEAVQAAKDFPRFRVLGVNALLFNNAGSYITQELAYALAWGNELMKQLTGQGIDPSLAASSIKFNWGISSNYFMEIAKFRAARWLWAEIAKAYGASDEAAKMNSFAQTSHFNQTIYDAHVNLLRSQTEAMSAGIAGVDSLLVAPFDESFKTPDEFSERIARNQQLLLKEEAHFDAIVDASGGSYYIETLTASIAQQAWKLFLETEEKGFYEMVKAGEIQQAVNASGEARRKALAQRREILLGTNQFPNFTETAGQKAGQTATCGCGCDATDNEHVLNTTRLSEDYEALRLSTERSGKTPKAFMLTIGNLAMRLARSQFACNFFACAGYQVVDNLGFETVEAGIKAAREAQADIVVLCSSDDEYEAYAPEAFNLTKGKEMLVVAGAPACMDDLKTQGIEHFINVRSNVLDTLKVFNAKLGIN